MRREGGRKYQDKDTVSVHLTEAQKTVLKTMAEDMGVDMAQIGRGLIRRLLGDRAALLTLLQKYQAEIGDKRAANRPAESRTYRFCIRLSQEEKRNLDVLADEWFYLPGELARILFELFIGGIISKRDIWGS